MEKIIRFFVHGRRIGSGNIILPFPLTNILISASKKFCLQKLQSLFFSYSDKET